MSELMINQNGWAASAPVYPNPMPEELTADFINRSINGRPYKHLYAGDYIYTVESNNDESSLVRINIYTCQVESFPTNYNMQFIVWSFANAYIWALVLKDNTYVVIQIDPESAIIVNEYPCINGVNGSSGLPEMIFVGNDQLLSGAVNDGENIWFQFCPDRRRHYLIKFNCELHSLKGIYIPELDSSTGISFSANGIIYNGNDSVWALYRNSHDNSMSYLINVDINTEHHTAYEVPVGVSKLLFDGENLWFHWARSPIDKLYKFIIATKQIIEYPFDTNDARPANGCFDGKYIWYPIANWRAGLYRLDPSSGEIKLIEIQNQQTGYSANTLVFDGNNLWNCTTENTSTYFFEKIYPADHTDTHTITTHFQDEQGQPLRPSATGYAEHGGTFTANALGIDGYTCIGYRVDGGALQAGPSATLDDVRQDHEIVFVYRKDDDGGPGDGGNGDGKCCCCCCTKVDVRISTCSKNRSLLRDIDEALARDGESWDCPCGMR